MRRWIPRALPALLVSFTLPAAARAQQPPPAAAPPQATTPPPVAAPAPPAPAPGAAGPAVAVPAAPVYLDPYHAATPYNPTVTGQTMPNPAWNRPVTTLPCGWPNQNFDQFVPPDKGCGRGGLKGGCGKGGCNGGCDGGCDGGKHAGGWLKGACAGSCSKGGSCTTCCNTDNFVFGSSRSFFGESSREFFERPPSPDGVKMMPVKYAPPPAPAAYTPANVIVP